MRNKLRLKIKAKKNFELGTIYNININICNCNNYE